MLVAEKLGWQCQSPFMRLIFQSVVQWRELNVTVSAGESLRNQQVAKLGIFWQQRAMQVRTVYFAALRAFSAVFAVVSIADHDFAQRLQVFAKICFAAVVFKTHQS